MLTQGSDENHLKKWFLSLLAGLFLFSSIVKKCSQPINYLSIYKRHKLKDAKWNKRLLLTNINESPRSSATKSLALEAKSDLDDPGNVSGRGLDSNRVRRDQLAPDQHLAEDHLKPVEEIVADDDDRWAARRPTLGGRNGFYAGNGRGRVQTVVQTYKMKINVRCVNFSRTINAGGNIISILKCD